MGFWKRKPPVVQPEAVEEQLDFVVIKEIPKGDDGARPTTLQQRAILSKAGYKQVAGFYTRGFKSRVGYGVKSSGRWGENKYRTIILPHGTTEVWIGPRLKETDPVWINLCRNQIITMC